MRSKPRKKHQKSRKLRRTTREQRPTADITIKIGLPSPKFAETIYESLIPETRQSQGFRSRTVVSRRGRILTLNIKASDIVALRAASNSFLRFVSVAAKTLSVVAPFYSAQDPDAVQTSEEMP